MSDDVGLLDGVVVKGNVMNVLSKSQALCFSREE